jgi:hypothetical protein
MDDGVGLMLFGVFCMTFSGIMFLFMATGVI